MFSGKNSNRSVTAMSLPHGHIMNIYISMYDLFATYFVVAAAGKLIQTPQNAIGLWEDRVILECATNSSGIAWFYDSRTAVVERECDSSSRLLTTTRGSNATHCSLVVHGTNTTRLSGPFDCSDDVESAQAVVVIIGKHSISPEFKMYVSR